MAEHDDRMLNEMKAITAAHQVPQRTGNGATPPMLGIQRDHDLLHDSLDKIGNGFVQELQRSKKNADEIEHRVLERISKLKNGITQLYLLGNLAMQEAKRSDDTSGKVFTELDKLDEEDRLSTQ